uniref:Uncharacterized protein n=1 Tax=Solanum tuberosum TaxID=4113 RepID=M1DKN5_SOLTU
MLWAIGRYGTTSRNCSTMRRLLPFSADLILFFRAQHTRTNGELTQDQKGLVKDCNGVECKVAGEAVCIYASVPGVSSDGIEMPDPLEATVGISVGNVWITGCTIVSIRSGKSLNMPLSLLYCVSSSCTDINLSSVSASDPVCSAPSLCTSPIVSGASSSSAFSISEVNSIDLIVYVLPQTCNLAFKVITLEASPYMLSQAMTLAVKESTEVERGDEETPKAYEEEEEGVGIPEGSEARSGEDASAGNESILTSAEVSVGAALRLSTSSRVN